MLLGATIAISSFRATLATFTTSNEKLCTRFGSGSNARFSAFQNSGAEPTVTSSDSRPGKSTASSRRTNVSPETTLTINFVTPPAAVLGWRLILIV
jgi:hypothetical protein